MKRQTEDNVVAGFVILTYVVITALSIAWVGFLVWAGIQLVQWITTL